MTLVFPSLFLPQSPPRQGFASSLKFPLSSTCIMRLSPLPPETPSSFFFLTLFGIFWAARKEKRVYALFLGFLLQNSTSPLPKLFLPLCLLVFHLLRWKLTLSLNLFRPPLFILWLAPCETIPRLTPN